MEPPQSTLCTCLEKSLEDGRGRLQLLDARGMGDCIDLGTEETVLCGLAGSLQYRSFLLERVYIIGGQRSGREVNYRTHAVNSSGDQVGIHKGNYQR